MITQLSLRSFCFKLLEHFIHDSCSQQDFSIRNWYWSTFLDRMVERFHQVLHARIHMKIAGQKQFYVCNQIAKMLFRELRRRNELIGKTFVFVASKFQEDIVILVENQPIFGTIHTQLMDRGLHL